MTLFAMNLLDGASLSELVERVGWVLFHSVWQFSILATLLLAGQLLLAKRSAASRYLISSITMCAMVGACDIFPNGSP